MLLIELDLVLRGLWRLLFLRCVHRWGLLRRRHRGIVSYANVLVLEDRLLLQLVLRRTNRLGILLLLLLEDLWQVGLALEDLVRRTLIALLHLLHPRVHNLADALLMDQLRLANRSVVVRSLHRLDLTLELRCTACVDRRDLLIAHKHGLAINTLTEAKPVLACAHATMACLSANTAEQVLVASRLRFCTLVASHVTLARALIRGKVT